jgi:hypothetical protein
LKRKPLFSFSRKAKISENSLAFREILFRENFRLHESSRENFRFREKICSQDSFRKKFSFLRKFCTFFCKYFCVYEIFFKWFLETSSSVSDLDTDSVATGSGSAFRIAELQNFHDLLHDDWENKKRQNLIFIHGDFDYCVYCIVFILYMHYPKISFDSGNLLLRD